MTTCPIHGTKLHKTPGTAVFWCEECELERYGMRPAAEREGLTDAELVALAALVNADAVSAGWTEGECPDLWPAAKALHAELERRGVLPEVG